MARDPGVPVGCTGTPTGCRSQDRRKLQGDGSTVEHASRRSFNLREANRRPVGRWWAPLGRPRRVGLSDSNPASPRGAQTSPPTCATPISTLPAHSANAHGSRALAKRGRSCAIPRCWRIRSITTRSLIAAVNRIRPPQRQHASASTPHTRCSSVAWSRRVSSARCTAAIPAAPARTAASAPLPRWPPTVPRPTWLSSTSPPPSSRALTMVPSCPGWGPDGRPSTPLARRGVKSEPSRSIRAPHARLSVPWQWQVLVEDRDDYAFGGLGNRLVEMHPVAIGAEFAVPMTVERPATKDACS